MSLIFLTSLVRLVRARLRSFASANGIVPADLAPQDPAEDSEAEARYRKSVAALESIFDGILEAMPPEIRIPLESGEIGPFLARAPIWFDNNIYAFAFLSTLIAIRAQNIENWLDGGEPGRGAGDLAFFASQPVTIVLESSIFISRALQGMLKNPLWKPGMAVHGSLIATLRIGFLNLATLRMFKSGPDGVPEAVLTSTVHDVAIVTHFLAALASVFPGVARISDQFRKVLQREALEDEDGEESGNSDQDGSECSSFPMTIKAVDSWIKEIT
jgi:hypothetical protein